MFYESSSSFFDSSFEQQQAERKGQEGRVTGGEKREDGEDVWSGVVLTTIKDQIV